MRDRIIPVVDLMERAKDFVAGVAAPSSSVDRIIKPTAQALLDGTKIKSGRLRKLFNRSFGPCDFHDGSHAFLA